MSSDADGGEDATAPPADASGTGPDASPGPACGATGSGRLRVTVSVDPSLATRPTDVWLAARCSPHDPSGNGAASVVRVVRWDHTGTQTIDGLGHGSYVVFASTFVSPGSWSPEVVLEGVATAAVPVTLTGTIGALGRYSSRGASDAGTPPDAGAGTDMWRGRAAILDPRDRSTVGELEVSATPSAGGNLLVQVLVRNVCAVEPCGLIEVHSAEARTLDGETPVGLATEEFERTRIQRADAVELPRPIALAGAVPDGARRVLEVAVYGTLIPRR